MRGVSNRLIDIQRIRNLTTGKLHTSMANVQEDIDWIAGYGTFTHQIPDALKLISPWLMDNLRDPRLFNGKYDPHHLGTLQISCMSDTEKEEFSERMGTINWLKDGK